MAVKQRRGDGLMAGERRTTSLTGNSSHSAATLFINTSKTLQICNEEAPSPSRCLPDGHREEGGGWEPPCSRSNSRLARSQDVSVAEIQRGNRDEPSV